MNTYDQIIDHTKKTINEDIEWLVESNANNVNEALNYLFFLRDELNLQIRKLKRKASD